MLVLGFFLSDKGTNVIITCAIHCNRVVLAWLNIAQELIDQVADDQKVMLKLVLWAEDHLNNAIKLSISSWKWGSLRWEFDANHSLSYWIFQV